MTVRISDCQCTCSCCYCCCCWWSSFFFSFGTTFAVILINLWRLILPATKPKPYQTKNISNKTNVHTKHQKKNSSKCCGLYIIFCPFGKTHFIFFSTFMACVCVQSFLSVWCSLTHPFYGSREPNFPYDLYKIYGATETMCSPHEKHAQDQRHRTDQIALNYSQPKLAGVDV